MIKEASQRTLRSLLGQDSSGNKSLYYIPPYQREYSWGKEHWDNLFNDLNDNDNGYFLGSIICILKNSQKSYQVVDVIDGQQRLTTLNILLLAIFSKISTLRDSSDEALRYISDDDEYNSSWLELKRFIKEKEDVRFTPSIQKNNLDDYNYLVQLVFTKAPNAPAYWKSRKIAKAYDYFLEKLDEMLESLPEDRSKINRLFKYFEKIASSFIVRIDTEDANSAFILFESINNRGTPLTPIDLIKNSLIGKHQQDPERTNEEWQRLINNIEDYEPQVRFLRHYYHAFSNNSLVKLDGYASATKSNLIKIYSKLIERDASTILSDLIKKSEIYKFFSYPDELSINDKFYDYKAKLIDLDRLGVAPAYSLLLYLFETYPEEEFSELLNYIEQWFIVRHLTNTPATNKLDQIFQEIILTQQQGYNFNVIHTKLVNYLPKREVIYNALIDNDLYSNSPNLVRSLLICLEKQTRNRESMVDFWEIKTKGRKKSPVWSVEHIYPQQPKDSDWQENCSENTHKLGNLTLSAYNSKLSNDSFEKKSKANEDGKDVGLKSGNININEYLLTLDSWRNENIHIRSSLLAESFLENIFR